MSQHRIATFGLALATLSLTAWTHATEDLPGAERLFKKGAEAMKAGNYAEACPAFAESYRLAARPRTRFAMAECEAGAGRIATAVTLYGDFLKTAASIDDAAERKKNEQQVKKAQATQAELAKQIPELTLKLSPSAPPDTQVTRDGVTLTSASLGVAMPVDPNPVEHVITVQAPGGDLEEIRVRLERGEKATKELMPPLPPKQADNTGPGTGSTGAGVTNAGATGVTNTGKLGRDKTSKDMSKGKLRTAGFVAGSAGIGGLIAGSVLGGLAMQTVSSIEKHCPNAMCDSEGFATAQSGQRLGLGSTLAFGVGVAGLAAGVVMIVMSRNGKEPSKPNTQVGLLEVGPMGAMVGVKGAF